MYTGTARERFIEAITDERYEIVTILHPEFTFKGKQCVKILQDIDGTLRVRSYLNAEQRQPKTDMTDVLKSVRSMATGTFQSIGLSFGAISPSEHVDLSPEDETSEVQKRGRIIAKIQRGSKETKPGDERNLKRKTFLPEQTSKKVAFHFGKSHGLK